MADHAHNTHVHGTMDVREQEKTFNGFIKISTWVCIVSVVVLVFMGLANA